MRPAAFSDLGFEAALAHSVEARTLLVVDAMAPWCPPCRLMDRTAWVDAAVVAWIGEHAIAVQVNTDDERGFAQEFTIEVLPTMLAFVDGEEVGRITGAHKPADVLAWLERVTRGDNELGALRAAVAAAPADAGLRLQLARALANAALFAEAQAELNAVWRHAVATDHLGIQPSELTRDLEQLVTAFRPARPALMELRDRIAVDASDALRFHEWVCLNRALGETVLVLAWFDALPARQGPADVLERDVLPLLIAAGRWADAGALYTRPVAAFLAASASVDRTPIARNRTTQRIVGIVRALRAAGRLGHADDIEERARELDPSAEMSAALDAARQAE